MFAGGDTMDEHLEGLKQARFADFGPHLVVGPMYHTGPLSGMRILVAGTSSVILGRFDAERTLAAIDRHRTRSAVMVPTHFVRLLALPEEVRDRYDVSSMELVAHTGAKCPDDVKRAMIDWWGPVFLEAYGASEVGTTCSITSQEWLAHPGSVGQADPPFEALIVDDDDRPVPPNTEGRLYFRDTTGRGVVYHNDPEKSAAAHLEPGVFTLGEIGYLDEDGFVYITDRFSDMVVSGGVNLYPGRGRARPDRPPAGRRRGLHRGPAPRDGRGAAGSGRAGRRRRSDRGGGPRASAASGSRRSSAHVRSSSSTTSAAPPWARSTSGRSGLRTGDDP